MPRSLSHVAALVLALLAPAMAYATPAPYDKVDAVFGKKSQALPGNVYKYTWPRSDLHVTVNGTTIAPGLALGSWGAFTPIKDQTWVMGDLVLLQPEVGPVVERLQESNFEITGIHNHLINETPRVMYVHYMGRGDPEQLATSLRSALEQTRTPLKAIAARPSAKSPPGWVSEIESALGRKGKFNGQVYGVSVPRVEADRTDNETIPSGMGLETALNFQQVSGKIVSTGDFVLIGSEVNPVIKTLQQHRIAVTALHNHMLADSPHLFFLHYWALGDSSDVAAGLKAALADMNVKPSPL
jgi:Domain of Unknown Function (DUF1259)